MRVVHLLCQMGLDSHCGTPAHVVDLSEELTRAGNEVTIIAGRAGDPRPASQLREMGIRLVEFDYQDLYSFSASLENLPTLLRGLGNAMNAAAPCVASPETVLHLHDLPHGPWIADVLDRHAPTPYLTTSHGADLMQAECDPALQRVLQYNRYGSHLVGVASYLTPILRQYARNAKVGNIPGGAKQLSSGPATDGRTRRSSNQLLYVGRLAPEKGVMDLPPVLAAVAEDSDACLTVVGDGPLRAELASAFDSHGWGRRVVFLGWVEESRVEELMRTAATLIFPSRWAEPFARTLLQAARCELPIVTRATGGSPELLGNSYPGLVSGLASAAEIATKVGAVLQSAELRQTMATMARLRVVENFNWTSISRSYCELYGQCLASWGQQALRV